MKKTVTLIFFLTSFFCGIHAQITLDADLEAALPSGQFFLPAPPAENSLIWRDDTTTYFQYKRAAPKNSPSTSTLEENDPSR